MKPTLQELKAAYKAALLLREASLQKAERQSAALEYMAAWANFVAVIDAVRNRP